MKALLRSFAFLAGMALVADWGAVRAEVNRLGPNGVLHRIDILPSGSADDATTLRHSLQDPTGLVHLLLVPGTQDPAIERDPAIEIDPVTGQPVLVWLRVDGVSTAVRISRFDGSDWSDPVIIASDAETKSRPVIRIGEKVIHVAYRQGLASPPASYLVSVDRLTFANAYGPVPLTVDEASPVPVDGAPAGEAPLPESDDFFFTMDGPPRLPDERPRIIVYGARDEPVPVNFLQGFLLPVELEAVDFAGAEFFYGHFVVWYGAADRFYYVYREPTSWSDTRIIRLDPLTVADARLLLRDALSRWATPSSESVDPVVVVPLAHDPELPSSDAPSEALIDLTDTPGALEVDVPDDHAP
jgi:hypothetical protein